MRTENIKHYIIGIIVLLILAGPLIGTFLFSVASMWQTTILPEGYTLQWYIRLFHDIRFLDALMRSFLVCSVTVALGLAVMIPAVFAVDMYYPKLENLLRILVIIPFAIPGVILAVGILTIYSKRPVAITGTLWILIFAYFVVIQPYIYQTLKNSLNTANASELMDAAELLGASRKRAFFSVVLPNMSKGVIGAALISFSFLFGEFVLANMLAGGNFETVQIYMYGKLMESGHITCAVVIIYFAFILLVSGLLLGTGRLLNKSGN